MRPINKRFTITLLALFSGVASANPFTPTQINDAVYVSLAHEVATVQQALHEELQADLSCEIKNVGDRARFAPKAQPMMLALSAKKSDTSASE